MPRLLAIALILVAEINFRCVPTTACEDDEQRCAEKHAETEGETEGETETDGETGTGSEGEPMPDLAAR